MQTNSLSKYKYLFWEYDINDIDLDKHRALVIERLLEKGSFESIKWLFSYYEVSDIRNVLNNHKNISPKTTSFWQNYFKLNG